MFYKYGLPLIAAGLLIFALALAIVNQRPDPDVSPPVPPPLTPFGDTVAGLGMVEPSTEASGTSTIAVGSQLAGAVSKVSVLIGQHVKAGTVLVELDPQLTNADLKVREANVAVADAQIEVAEANFRQMEDQYVRARKLIQNKAIPPQEFVANEQAYLAARAQVSLAKANAMQARAMVDQDRTTLSLLQVRAPVDGTILQINVRPGEYVATFTMQSLILMGNLQPLHVRVNVDEEDIPRLKLYAPARAKIRGDASQEEVPMAFVRLEPYVVPKTSLTGINTERVDTRVVQVIYAVDPNHRLVQEKKLLVGQIVDVFIDARPIAESIKPQGAP